MGKATSKAASVNTVELMATLIETMGIKLMTFRNSGRK